MDVWSEWEDPVELRMRLDAALVEIAELTKENDRLRQQLGLGVHHPVPEHGLPYADASSAEDKLALFRALFVGRSFSQVDAAWGGPVSTRSARGD